MSEFVNTIDVIGDDALTDSILMRTVTEYKSNVVTKIGRYAFRGCNQLVNVEVPNVTVFDRYAFFGCSKLTMPSLPSGLTIINENALSGCTKLTITSIPSTVTSIGFAAFRGISNTSITFKGKPNLINSSAFENCSKITTINVPWAEGEVANAPWGATNATINYNYTGE